MKRNEDFRQALGQPDDDFRNTVMDTLNELNREAAAACRPEKRISLRLICTFAAVLVAVTGILLAERTGRWDPLGWFSAGTVDQINPTAIPLASPHTAESPMVVISCREAITDGTGLFLTAEIKPRNDKILPLLWDINPYYDNAQSIGREPDYPGQTLYQWAVEHGYEEIAYIMLTTPWPDEICSSNLNTFNNHPILGEDGSYTIHIAGGAVPGADTYDLYWRTAPYDMTQTSLEISNGVWTPPLLDEAAVEGCIQIRPLDADEVRDYLAEYRPVGEQEAETTVSFFRTSRSDYYEIRTRDKQFADCVSAYLTGDGIDPLALSKTDRPYISTHTTLEDGTLVILETWVHPETFPDRMTMQLSRIGDDRAQDPPEIEIQKEPGMLFPFPAAISADGDYLIAFKISKGAAEGLEAGQAVENNSALIGVITEVREHEATVSTVYNPDSIIDVIIPNDYKTQGLVRGAAGETASPGNTPLCRMVYFPDDAPVSPGDTVVTSGSAILPKGIPIGTVTEIVTDPESGKPYAYVEPAADFRNLQTVTVFLLNPEPLSSDPD